MGTVGLGAVRPDESGLLPYAVKISVGLLRDRVMLRILVIIAVALAVVIGLMQLAKHNNAVQAPDAAAAVTPQEEAAVEPSGVVDASGAAIDSLGEPASEPAQTSPADAPADDAGSSEAAEPTTERAPENSVGAAVQESRQVERPRRVIRKAAEPDAPIDPYELQRGLPQPSATAPQPAPAAEQPASEAPAPAEAAPQPSPADPQPDPQADASGNNN